MGSLLSVRASVVGAPRSPEKPSSPLHGRSGGPNALPRSPGEQLPDEQLPDAKYSDESYPKALTERSVPVCRVLMTNCLMQVALSPKVSQNSSFDTRVQSRYGIGTVSPHAPNGLRKYTDFLLTGSTGASSLILQGKWRETRVPRNAGNLFRDQRKPTETQSKAQIHVLALGCVSNSEQSCRMCVSGGANSPSWMTQ